MTDSQSKIKYTRWIAGLAALALMGVIFALSAQPGDASDEVSIRFTSLLFFLQGEEAALVFNSVVREAAHMLEYALLAIPVYVFFSTFRALRRWCGCAAFAVCLFYAATDELHQMFVPDRAAELFDLLMDGLGAAIAVCALRLRSKQRRKAPPAQLAPAEREVLEAFSAYLLHAPFSAPVEDVQAFQAVSARHKILPMTAQMLAQVQPPPAAEALAAIRLEAMSQMIVQTRKTEQFLRTCRALQHAGITPLCVKGVVCRQLYPEFDLRISADEDLLVRASELPACEQVLASLGFTVLGEPGASETGYFHADSGCMIELHRSLFPEDGGVYSRFNRLLGDLFAQPESLQIGGTALLCPAPEQHLLYLILHAYKHFLISGVGIRQLADIALFARMHTVDWPALFAACDSVRLAGFVSAVLVIGGRYFGLNTAGIHAPQFRPEIDAAPLLLDVMQGGIYGPKHPDHLHSGALTFQQYAAALTDGRGRRLAALFPPREQMQRKFPYVRRHGWLLPAAYLSRLARYAASEHDAARTLDTADRRTAMMRKYGLFR